MKHMEEVLCYSGCAVAPHAGAWIETQSTPLTCTDILSPPTRGRGLKRDVPSRLPSGPQRRPPRGGVD